MFEMMGISSITVDLPSCDVQKDLKIIIDEYKNGEIIKSDTTGLGKNIFTYFRGDTIYQDYFDKMKVFIYSKEKEVKINFNTPAMIFGKSLKHCNDTTQQYIYHIRKWVYSEYYDTNKRKNLFTYASMWLDKKYGFYRFCGVPVLKEDDKDSAELLQDSPHYFTVGYILK